MFLRVLAFLMMVVCFALVFLAVWVIAVNGVLIAGTIGLCIAVAGLLVSSRIFEYDR